MTLHIWLYYFVQFSKIHSRLFLTRLLYSTMLRNACQAFVYIFIFLLRLFFASAYSRLEVKYTIQLK